MKNIHCGGKFNYYQIIAFLIIAVFGVIIYSSIFNAPFVVDDTSTIVENRHIRMNKINPEQIKEILKSPSPRPVANLSFALNYYFGQYNPEGYHFVNVFIHIINAILLFLFVKATLNINLIYNPSADKVFSYSGSEDTGKVFSFPVVVAFSTALIWLVNPLHTQSVTYTVQRMNSMAAMFYLASMLLYIKGRFSQKHLRKGLSLKTYFLFVGSLICGIAALASKEIAAALPLIIIIYEWFFFQNLSPIRSKKTLAAGVGSISFLCIVALMILSLRGGSLSDIFLSMYRHQDFTLPQRLLTELRVVVYYISQIVYPDPSRLNLAYDYPLSYSFINPWTTILGFGVIAGLTGFAVIAVKKDRLLSFCIIWFLVNLIIESSVIGLALIFEHRTYLPSMMVCLLFVMVLFRFVRDRRLIATLIGLIILGQSVWTYQRNTVWNDEIALWRDGISKSPDNAWMYLNLGTAVAKHDEKRGIFYIKKALQKKPYFPEALYALGVAYTNQNRRTDAVKLYKKAIKLDPNFIKAHYQLGVALIRSGDMAGAFDHFSKAVLIDPQNSKAHGELGNVLSQTGKLSKALEHYSEALRLDPENYTVYNNIGNNYVRMGNPAMAIEYYVKSLQAEPANLNTQKNLQNVLKIYLNSLKPIDAVNALKKYVRLYPEIALFQYNLRALLNKNNG